MNLQELLSEFPYRLAEEQDAYKYFTHGRVKGLRKQFAKGSPVRKHKDIPTLYEVLDMNDSIHPIYYFFSTCLILNNAPDENSISIIDQIPDPQKCVILYRDSHNKVTTTIAIPLAKTDEYAFMYILGKGVKMIMYKNIISIHSMGEPVMEDVEALKKYALIPTANPI